jgi:hypothetical protein
MFVNSHIAAALASERERDLLAGARRWRKADSRVEVEPVRMAPLTPAAPELEHPARDGRLALRITRARSDEAGHSGNARARERERAGAR